MYSGFGNTSNSGANAIINSLGGLLNNAQQSLQQNLNTLNQSNNGVLDPMQMTQLQMLTTNYLAEVQTITSVVKQIGDLDKTVATNIGS